MVITITFKGPQNYQNIPLEIRNSESLSLFKSNIKQIQSLPCRCKICRSSMTNLGYIFFCTMVPFVKC